MAQHRAIKSIEPLVKHLIRHFHERDYELPRNRAHLAPKVHLEVTEIQRDDVSLGGLGECGYGLDHHGPVRGREIADEILVGENLREGCVVEVPAQWEVAVVTIVAWLERAFRYLAPMRRWDDEGRAYGSPHMGC